MKGLLLKDWYMAKKYLRGFSGAIAAFLLLNLLKNAGMSYVSVYPVMLASIIPRTLLAYDEKNGWEQYCSTLPVTRAQYVTAKYIAGLIPTLAAALLTMLLSITGDLLRGSWLPHEYLMQLMLVIVFCFVLPAVQYMTMFRYGAVGGRLAYYLIFGISIVIAVFIPQELYDVQVAVPMYTGFAVLTLLAVGFYMLSWRLSIRFYEQRELG